MTGVWDELGFRSNPFSSRPVPPNDAGQRIFVGRAAELDILSRQFTDSEMCLTVEGTNGVGKTSLAQLAILEATRREVKPYLSLERPIALPERGSHITFIQDCQTSIGRTIVAAASNERTANLFSNSSRQRIDNLASMVDSNLGTISGNALEQRLYDVIDGLRTDNFTSGVIGIIDNVELAASSMEAQLTLEACRDRLLNLESVRWILCGTPGTISGAVASPRLQGYLSQPVRLESLSIEETTELVRRRYDAYAGPDACLPISTESFALMYGLLGCDLRSALAESSRFVSETGAAAIRNASERDRRGMLQRRLEAEGRRIANETAFLVGDLEAGVLEFLRDFTETSADFEWLMLSLDRPRELLLDALANLSECNLVMYWEESTRPPKTAVKLTVQGFLRSLYLGA